MTNKHEDNPQRLLVPVTTPRGVIVRPLDSWHHCPLVSPDDRRAQVALVHGSSPVNRCFRLVAAGPNVTIAVFLRPPPSETVSSPFDFNFNEETRKVVSYTYLEALK